MAQYFVLEKIDLIWINQLLFHKHLMAFCMTLTKKKRILLEVDEVVAVPNFFQ